MSPEQMPIFIRCAEMMRIVGRNQASLVHLCDGVVYVPARQPGKKENHAIVPPFSRGSQNRVPPRAATPRAVLRTAAKRGD